MKFLHTPNEPPFITVIQKGEAGSTLIQKKSSSTHEEHKIKMERALREIAQGEYDAEEAWELIRASLKEDDTQFAEKITDALLNLAINLNISSSNTKEAQDWYDITWKVAGFIDEKLPREAGKLEAVGDILRTKAKISESAITAEEALQRKNVPEILHIIGADKNKAKRKLIAKQLKIKESNLSRILLTMQNAGLVIREKQGQEAIFSLTELGTKYVKHPNILSPESPEAIFNTLLSSLPNMLQSFIKNELYLSEFETTFSAIKDAIHTIKNTLEAPVANIAITALYQTMIRRYEFCVTNNRMNDLPWLYTAELKGIASIKNNAEVYLANGDMQIGPNIHIKRKQDNSIEINITETEELIKELNSIEEELYPDLSETFRTALKIINERPDSQALLNNFIWHRLGHLGPSTKVEFYGPTLIDEEGKQYLVEGTNLPNGVQVVVRGLINKSGVTTDATKVLENVIRDKKESLKKLNPI